MRGLVGHVMSREIGFEARPPHRRREVEMSETLNVFLKKVSLFSGLSDTELDLLAQVAKEADWKRSKRTSRWAGGLGATADWSSARRRTARKWSMPLCLS
jgi:hypothetical protein